MKKEEQNVKVLIADDHKLMRKGLKTVIDAENDLQVIAEASDKEEVLNLIEEISPDILLMDNLLAEKNSSEAIKEIVLRRPTLRIIGLSFNYDADIKKSMLKAGATAYVAKIEAYKKICPTIRKEGEKKE